MATFNHAFTIAFEVKGSDFEDWEQCLIKEKEKVINALVARMEDIALNNDEFLQAVEGFDSFEE